MGVVCVFYQHDFILLSQKVFIKPLETPHQHSLYVIDGFKTRFNGVFHVTQRKGIGE